ncbi:MAG: hypothetical protein ABIO91_02985 [Pyrinomonadaceae bacterium]
MKRLESAIENLYSAFSDASKPESIDGCTHCLDDKDRDTLLSTPLRQIEPDDISSYASSAFLTLGDMPDYLYFLPRILEISATADWWWPDIEVTGRAIGNTEPNIWEPTRRKALNEFLSAKLSRLIETENFDPVDDWMCGIAKMGLEVGPFLEIIETDRAAIYAYYERNSEQLDEGQLSNAFWDPPNAGHDAIVQWLKSEKITKTWNEFLLRDD